MKTKLADRKKIAARKRAGKIAERKQFGSTIAIKELRIPVDGKDHPQRFEFPSRSSSR